MIFDYPYTDMHELNLDWFLAKFKEYYEHITEQDQKITTLEETVEQFTSFVTNYFDNLDVQTEINNKLDAMAADGTLLALIQPYYDQIVAAQNQRIGTLETTAVSLQNQINEIVAPDPDPTLAEVSTARVDVNGVTYPSLKLRCDGDQSAAINTNTALEYATGNKAIYIDHPGLYLTITSNVIDINDPLPSSTGYGYTVVPAKEGEQFTVSGISSNNSPMAWAFIDNDGTILSKAAANVNLQDNTIIAPADTAYLVIHDKTPYRLSYKGVPALNSAKSAFNNTVIINDMLKTDSDNLFNPEDPNIRKHGYYLTTGNWQNDGDYFAVMLRANQGDKFYRKYPSGTDSMTGTAITFYDRNFNYISGLGGSGTYVTVPSNNSIYYMSMPLANTFLDAQNGYEYGVISHRPITAFKYYGENAYSSLIDGHQWKNKEWYAYGTSLTSTSLGKYAPYVASFSGLNLNNKGIPGGALVANRNVYNALNDLTDGKVDADLITIEVGANDWTSPLGDPTSMDDTTLCGALNTSLKTILLNCPKAQVVLMNSTCSRKNDAQTEDLDLDTANSYGVTVEERNEALRQVAVANGIYFIPMGSGLGLGLFRMQSSDLYNIDQIHHTDLGGYNLAMGIWSYLKNIPLWFNSLP